MTDNIITEIWKPCVQDSRYVVSNLGRIRRVVATYRHPVTDECVKPILNSNGYLTVKFYQNGKICNYRVHQLICRAFHGDPLPYQTDVNHIDNDRTNNCADNLHWCTRKENLHWGKQQGRDNCGERNGQAKLQPDQVREIKRLLQETTMNHAAIGALFGVGDGAVQLINVGKRWKHIE